MPLIYSKSNITESKCHLCEPLYINCMTERHQWDFVKVLFKSFATLRVNLINLPLCLSLLLYFWRKNKRSASIYRTFRAACCLILDIAATTRRPLWWKVDSQFLWQWLLAKLQLSSPITTAATGQVIKSDRFLRVYMKATHMCD